MSNDIPSDLQMKLRDRKVIPFVGAGVSCAVLAKETSEPLFPNWKELLDRAVIRLQRENRQPYADAVRGLANIGPEKYLDAAKHAREGLTGGLWFSFLKDELDIPRERVADASLDLARAVWSIGNLVITTNYDKVLQWACPVVNDLTFWDIEATAEQAIALQSGVKRPTLWHLHGKIDNAVDIILTPDGYQRLYSEAGGEAKYQAALTTLRNLMTSHTLLFIGYSLDDAYLGMQLKGLSEIFHGANGPHYVLMQEGEAERTRGLIRERGLPVAVLSFEDFGEPLISLVRYVGQTAGKANPATESLSRISSPGSPSTTRPNYDPANAVFYVPYRPKGNQVVGRKKELEDLRRALVGGRRTSIGQAVAFIGLGGLGKTQLAVEYAYNFKDEYPNGVIWINADQDIEAQLSDLAEKAKWIAPESEHTYKLAVAKHRLKTYSDCLIIFDNLENIKTIEAYLPEPQANPHLLITSRYDQPGFPPLPLDPLNDEQSLTLLTQEVGRQPGEQIEQDAARKIVEALGGLPLALELAGGYLRHRHATSYAQYQELLSRNLKSAMPGKFLAGSFTKHEADIYSTLKLNEGLFVDEPRLKDIIDLLTWSGPASTGLSLMCQLLGVKDATDLTSALGLGMELRLLQKPPGQERYAIHRLVREVRREDVPLEGRQEWIDTTCKRMGDWFQERRQNFSSLPFFEAEIDHLRAWQEHAVKYANRHASRLTWLQAYPPFHQGRYRESKEWVEKALELLEGSGLVDKELEANLLNDRGTTYGNLGDHKLALEYAERALAIQLELFGEKHPNTALSLNNVGLGYGALGAHKLALEYAERALAIRLDLFGEKHPDTAHSLSSVGHTYGALGDHKRALEYEEKALAIRREIFGEKHPDTAHSLNNVGATYNALGDHKRALEYAERALAIRREIFGEKHPNTALSLNNVGAAYSVLGNHRLALEYTEKALAIRREIFGEKHPDTVLTVVNLSSAYTKAGKGLKAVALLSEFMSILSKNHPAYNRLRQRKQEVLGQMMGGGFRTHTSHTKGNRPSGHKKKRR